MEVHRNGYSVTVPEEASAYFNVLTAAKKPADVLRWAQMTAVARAAAQARSKLMRALLFAQDKGADFPDIDEVNVVTFDASADGSPEDGRESFEEKRDHFYRSLPKDLDTFGGGPERMLLTEQAQMPRPTIVVGFLPPYYPVRLNRRQSPDEQNLEK